MAEDATPSTVLEGDDSFVSLYRRYRPGTFGALRGQPHVVLALRGAVAEDKVGHAYLFSGPRGTGKTSTARILAKALNCTNPQAGEPCGTCPSCVEITKGTSLDVTELDAASNNGVDAMRDLVAHASLGSPGRYRVYIVDEVHMLSNAAANALLKTLEEPPPRVVFVLATTDPQKVPATIRSRTQHLEFRLLGAETLSTLLADVRNAAHLDVDDAALDAVVRRAKGSARDALSALDQVAAAGTAEAVSADLSGVVAGVANSDAQGLLVALAVLHENGWGPQQLASELVGELRQGFLALLAPDLVDLVGTEAERVRKRATEIGLARIVRTMEAIGKAQVQMRDAPDPHVVLELALVRAARLDLDDSPAALAERVAHLEARLRDGGVPTAAPSATHADQRPARSVAPAAQAAIDAATEAANRAAAAAPVPPAVPLEQRKTLKQIRAEQGGQVAATPGHVDSSPAASTPPPTSTSTSTAMPDSPARAATEVAPAVHPAGASHALSLDAVRDAWQTVRTTLPPRSRAIVMGGTFTALDGGRATLAFPNATHATRAAEHASQVVDGLQAVLGQRVEVVCVGDGAAFAAEEEGGPGGTDEGSAQDFAEMVEDSTLVRGGEASPAALIQEIFPGATSIS